jgi:hypothetical protein
MRTLINTSPEHLPKAHYDGYSLQGMKEACMPAIDIVHADVTDFSCDVLALKYAQDFYGADAQIADTLSLRRPKTPPPKPLPDQHVLIQSRGAIAARHVLFVGVPSLYMFDYLSIRNFAARSLAIIAKEVPTALHVGMTIHGVRFGLDEREAFLAQLGGIGDAEKIGISMQRVSIIERDLERVSRLKAILKEIMEPLQSSGTAEVRSVVGQKHVATAGEGSNMKPHIFVAMPFAKEFQDVYIFGIQGPINNAGYLCERVDMVAFTGDILDRVKSRIETASLVIADLTGANPNVYLEVGYAWGKGRPTLLLAREGEEPKFDLRQQRRLVYQNIFDLSQRLQADLADLKATF